MRIVSMVLVSVVLLTGCTGTSEELERGMLLRSRILKAEQVSFSLDVSADYGDTIQLFSMDCCGNETGDIGFAVTAPQTLAGIRGNISEGTGKFTFEETALCFDLLTDEQLNPVSAPWILMKTLRGGYLKAAGMEGDLLRLTIDDSFEDDALQLDIWLDESDIPQWTEICYDGRTILTMSVRDFRIL